MTAAATDDARSLVASEEALGKSSRATKTRRKARAHRRVAVRCGCWLEHEQATVFGNTVDVGRGGLFLRTALPVRPGAAVRVTLQLPGRGTVIADGKVVRKVESSEGDRPGLGVRFERLPDGEASLCAFLFGSTEQPLLDELAEPQDVLRDTRATVGASGS